MIEDPTQLRIIEYKQERKWAHRKMWKPEKRFNITRLVAPSETIMQLGDMLIMHPAMAKKVRAATEHVKLQ